MKKLLFKFAKSGDEEKFAQYLRQIPNRQISRGKLEEFVTSLYSIGQS